MTLTRRAALLAAAGATLAPLAGPVPALAAPEVPAAAPPLAPALRSRWVPADYQEEWIAHLEDDPSAWLVPRDGGHVLADRDGDDPEGMRRMMTELHPEDAPPPAPLLKDGQVIQMGRTDDLGDVVLTVLGWPTDEELDAGAEDQWRWTLDRPMPEPPPGATLHIALADDPEICDVSLHDFARELEPGEHRLIVYAWSYHRFVYRAATGRLEPVEAPHGA